MKLTRRTFLKLGAVGTVASIAGLGYSRFIEPERLSLERVTIQIPRLPPAFEGFRIAVLSDFHLQPFTTLPHIEDAVAMTNELRPDLAVLLGDFVDATADAIHDLAPALARLNARMGVYSVLGNHDHWKGPKIVRTALERAGILVLENSGVMLAEAGENLYLAGLESAWCGKPDLDTALAGHREGKPGTPSILLIHEPDFADTAATDGRIALQISGHSHGGQVRLPLLGALQLPSWGRRYDHGLYQVRDMYLYTNRGIGVSDVPVRFNCPPEVTEITLRGAPV
jgi:predicted MPP superfamily phosphohydrolase